MSGESGRTAVSAARFLLFSQRAQGQNIFVLGYSWLVDSRGPGLWGLGVVAGVHFLQFIHPWQLGTEPLVERCFLARRFLHAPRAGTVRAHFMKCLETLFGPRQ